MIAALSLTGTRYAAYMAVGLLVGMIGREYVRAFVTVKLGDQTPRLWGRLSFSPKTWFDPFGSGFIPAVILVLFASGSQLLPPPFAYAKAAALDPSYLKRGKRDVALVSLAGPVTNLLLALVPGIALRFTTSGETYTALFVLMFTNLSLCVMHLMPIPGLDGARLVGLLLAPRPREVYRNLDQYLPLFILLLFFVLGSFFERIVFDLTNSLASVITGS